MNISILKINFTGIAPKDSSSRPIQQKPALESDVFVKSAASEDAGATAPKQGEFWYTGKEEHPISDKEIDEINSITERLAKRTERTFEARRACIQRRNKLEQAYAQKSDEVLKLYESKAQSTPQGGKIIIRDNEMLEYDESGKHVVRKTTFEDDTDFVTKRSLFGKYKLVKAKVKVPTITEFNPDGTKSVFSKEECVTGYRKNPDGSEKYESKFVETSAKGYERSYSEGYRKDADGNESYKASLYCNQNGTDVYAEDEKKSKNGSVSIKNIYVPDAAYARVGLPPETVIAGYEKDPDGAESYAEKSICTYGGKLHLYVKNYTKAPDGKEDWSKFLEIKQKQYKDSDNGKWFSYTPKHEYHSF